MEKGKELLLSESIESGRFGQLARINRKYSKVAGDGRIDSRPSHFFWVSVAVIPSFVPSNYECSMAG